MINEKKILEFLINRKRKAIDANGRCHDTFESKEYYIGIEDVCNEIITKIKNKEFEDA